MRQSSDLEQPVRSITGVRDAAAQRGYSTHEVTTVTGASYRQLDYWSRTGVLQSSLRSASGQGSRRLYSSDDVRAAAVLASLSTMLDQTNGSVSRDARAAAVRLIQNDDAARWLVLTHDSATACHSVGELVAQLVGNGGACVVIDTSSADRAATEGRKTA
jgi:hypothetical protein